MQRRRRASAEGVGALGGNDGSDGLGTSPKSGTSVYLTNPVRKFYCRFPADSLQAELLRPLARIKSDLCSAAVGLLPKA